MAVPLFTPDQVLAAKIADLDTRYQNAYNEVMRRIAPVDSWGVPMIWNAATQQYDVSPFDAEGHYR